MIRADIAPSIATLSDRAYLAPMAASRALRLLTMLAFLLMPFGMLGGEAAGLGHQAPMAASATAGHCAGMHHEQKDRPAKGADCTVACAAIPSADARYEHAAVMPMAAEAPRPVAAVPGLHPEAATPPPRIS